MKARKQIKGYALGGGIGGQSLWTGADDRPRTWVDQRTIDQQKANSQIAAPIDQSSIGSVPPSQPAQSVTYSAAIPSQPPANGVFTMKARDYSAPTQPLSVIGTNQNTGQKFPATGQTATPSQPPALPSTPAAPTPQKIAGLARGGKTPGSRPIPGKVDPTVADDVTINAKKGEFVLSVEDVALLGGADKLEANIKQLRKQAGLPTEMGPKRPDEPDAMGRMDKPGLNGKAGLADGGWNKIYETDPQKIGDTTTFSGGMKGLAGAAIGGIANTATGMMTTPEKMSDSSRGAAVPSNITEAFTPPTPGAAAVSVPLSPVIPIAKSASSKMQQPVSAARHAAALPAAQPPESELDRIKRLDERITNTRTVPNPNAGITQSMVQRPAPAIAGPTLPDGVKQFQVSKAIAGSGDTWRTGLDGKPYQVTGTNADGTRFDNDGFSRQMAADRKQAGIDAKYAMEVEASQKYAAAQKEAHNNRSLQQHFDDLLYSRNTLGMPEHVMWQLAGKNFAAQQEMNKANTAAESHKYAADQSLAGHKYAADQSLAGHKYTSDGNVKAHEITGRYGLLGHQATAEGNIEAHRIAGVAKGLEAQQKAQHEAYTKDEKEMKDLLTNKYGVDPNVSLPAYKKHLSNLRAWDSKVTKQFADLKKPNSGYPEVAGKLENYMRIYHTDPASKEGQSALIEAKKLVTGGGAGNPPPWFDMMTQKPVFNHNTLPKLPSSNQVQG